MTNDAAERMLATWDDNINGSVRHYRETCRKALAVERRATVERIRAALDTDSFYGSYKTPRSRLHAILDAEATQHNVGERR